MIEISTWIPEFLQILDGTFGDRIWFVGLQGSYSRGEATDSSDIDMVVVLNTLSLKDIEKYNDMLNRLPHRELICGFLSGKDELMNWEPADLFQFYHDTTPLKGSMDELLSLIDDAAVSRAIKIGACNIYHGCVHNMLYEKSEDILKGLYKAATFVVQAIYFQQSGQYLRHHAELISVVGAQERYILETYAQMKRGEEVEFSEMSEHLFNWTKEWINRT